jgi:trehalose/maltose hydrolase-like predicted phosphorylase
MSEPISPEAVRGSGRKDLPAYVANGLIGMRVRDVPLARGMALISGYAGEHPERHIEAAAVAPYPIAGDIAINGVWLSDAAHQASDATQAYDFGTGELTSAFTFTAGGCHARVEVLTFCSRPDPTLVCQEIAVIASAACSLTLRAVVDARGAEGKALRHTRETPGESSPANDGSLLWESAGGLSTCGVAFTTEVVGLSELSPKRPPLHDHCLVTEYAARARAGQAVRLRQIASLVPSAMHQLPDQHAGRLVAKAGRDGFDKLRSQNRAVWEDLWQGRIRLVGADARWQALADAAFFYLNCSVHSSSPASTSIFGLATWHDYHYYYGHVMWDIEAFAVAPLSVLQPYAAHALLDYRSSHLEGARRNARLWGRRGLQFPWESAPRSGEEAAPLPATAAWHEDHVSLDVAWAFAFYANVTADGEFLRNEAWPVLSGVAEWIKSRVSRTPEGYAIDDSMGIAERKSPVDNAAFTNMGAVVVLRAAADAAAKLGLAADPAWRDIAEGLAIPMRGKAIVSHDAYRVTEEKGATPDPLMGLFPFGYEAAPDVEQATLAFYLRTAQDYIGSPMLSSLYGVWAARSGDRALALELLDQGYGRFCEGRFMQTLEYRPDRFPEQPPAGPFFANIGGFLTGLLFGFTGMCIGPGEPGSWMRRPVVLPAGWKAIEVDRLWVHGRPMRLAASHGSAHAVLTAL